VCIYTSRNRPREIDMTADLIQKIAAAAAEADAEKVSSLTAELNEKVAAAAEAESARARITSLREKIDATNGQVWERAREAGDIACCVGAGEYRVPAATAADLLAKASKLLSEAVEALDRELAGQEVADIRPRDADGLVWLTAVEAVDALTGSAAEVFRGRTRHRRSRAGVLSTYGRTTAAIGD